eukprot:tig00001041_g6565.t1
MVKKVETEHEFEQTLKSNKVVIVDFYADWCGPCKMIAPRVEELAQKNPNVCFIKVNVDELDKLAESHGISAMPTFLSFVDGKRKGEAVGAALPKIEQLVADALA